MGLIYGFQNPGRYGVNFTKPWRFMAVLLRTNVLSIEVDNDKVSIKCTHIMFNGYRLETASLRAHGGAEYVGDSSARGKRGGSIRQPCAK